MFNKYWREFPWFLQLVQFVLLFFVCLAFFAFLATYLTPILTGVNIEDIQNIRFDSSSKSRIAFYIFQGLAHIGMFTISVALFAYATHPRPLEYLNLTSAKKPIQWLWVLLLALGAIPMMSGIASLFDMIPLSESLELSKADFATKQKAYLNMQTPAELITGLIVFGIIPAIGEELLFRGVMMKFAAKKMVGSIFWPIILSSVFFATMHGNVVGFISLMIAGMILGYVYYLTGSLLLSIFAHLVVNSTQVIISYVGRGNEDVEAFMNSNDIPWGLFIGGTLLFAGAMYMLWRDRTPLPPTWTSDFNHEELIEKENEQNDNSY